MDDTDKRFPYFLSYFAVIHVQYFFTMNFFVALWIMILVTHCLSYSFFLSFFFFFSQIFFRLLDILRVAKLTWLFVMVLLMVKQWFSFFFFFNGPVLFFALLYAVLFCSNWSSWHGWICSVPAYTSGKSWFLIDHPMSFLGTTSYSE